MFEPEETQDILVCAALETHGGSRIEGEPVLDPALERLTKHAVNDTAYQKVHEAVKGAILMTTTKASCSVDKLSFKQVCHYRVIACLVISIPLFTLLLNAHVKEFELAVSWLDGNSI